MKTIIFILILPFYLYAGVSCIGEIRAKKIYDLKFTGSGTELEDDYLLLDTNNDPLDYIDSDSAVCGGTKDEIIYMAGSCDNNSLCWGGAKGQKGSINIKYNSETKEFFNNVIVFNHTPCLPKNISNFTVGIYHTSSPYNNLVPISYAYGLINKYRLERKELLTKEVADKYRTICKETEPSQGKDYTKQLNTLIDNTSENKNIKEINDREEKLSDDLENLIDNRETGNNDTETLEGFQTTYEETLNNAFTNYSDVFGFGSYGSKPSPITFSFFEKNYKLFDVSIVDPYINLIRNTFSIFAYLFGIIIVFRSV